MKVILLQDVARIGRQFEIKEVPDGHALNFLIPKKLAEPATPANVKRVEARTGKKNAEAEASQEAFLETLSKLKDAMVTITASANDEGKLFKGLKADDIATAVSEQVGQLHASQVELTEPIKEVGEHTVAITAGGEKGTFSLKVEKE
ncbi:50S ribosomal protein L9 [Candidatus Kaiserbacteria bacterium]|nr:50S ribosomal protein L9 [Candidatus Kaiserbacteria bacterium]